MMMNYISVNVCSQAYSTLSSSPMKFYARYAHVVMSSQTNNTKHAQSIVRTQTPYHWYIDKFNENLSFRHITDY